MTKTLIAAAALTAASALPALANGYGTVSQTCYAEAEANAYSGSKYGYQVRYNQILQDCMARGTHRAPLRQKPVNLVHVPLPGCVPGAPKMYRGTLYCLN
ncbi:MULTISPECIES: hypothetical protein [Ponticoccus]|uniref:Uncharacterized protein n=1 Tax=Ponticoccus litoralis TaxID=422297 RepID=A0AAW9SJN3_9RHOB